MSGQAPTKTKYFIGMGFKVEKQCYSNRPNNNLDQTTFLKWKTQKPHYCPFLGIFSKIVIFPENWALPLWSIYEALSLCKVSKNPNEYILRKNIKQTNKQTTKQWGGQMDWQTDEKILNGISETYIYVYLTQIDFCEL